MKTKTYKPKLPIVAINGSVSFDNAYGNYCEKYKWLNEQRIKFGNIQTTALNEIAGIKEETAKIVLSQYALSPSITEFRKNITTSINDRADKIANPLSDTILATAKNLEIVEKFTQIASDFADGLLLTGSNTWGAFYYVKGGAQNNEKSDIDLLITAENLDQFGKIIDGYIAEGLVEIIEKQRFDIFCKLNKEKKADQFSLITNYQETPVSIDFIPLEIIRSFANLTQLRKPLDKRKFKEIDIRVVKEFRINPPRAAGYTIDDLRGQSKAVFHSNFDEIHHKNTLMGYLAETLVDGHSKQGYAPTYLLGVMSFFMGVDPVILLDKDQQLTDPIGILRSNIAEIMHGQTPNYITRQERMPTFSLERIKTSFSSQQVNSNIVSQV